MNLAMDLCSAEGMRNLMRPPTPHLAALKAAGNINDSAVPTPPLRRNRSEEGTPAVTDNPAAQPMNRPGFPGGHLV
jgi:hypothetical protein